MAEGYVYVLSNAAMHQLVKVGKTTTDPATRMAQLSSATGVPTKFELAKAYQVSDCDAAEAFAHRVLERMFERPNTDREFFSGEVDEIILVLDEALAQFRVAVEEEDGVVLFLGPMRRLDEKNFTFACQEFEEVFRSLPLHAEALATKRHLQTAAGAYVASCYAAGRSPYSPVILGPRSRAQILQKAIEFAKDFEDDPTAGLIRFSREHAAG